MFDEVLGLRPATSDVKRLHELLTKLAARPSGQDEIRLITDEAATRNTILDNTRRMAAASAPGDILLIVISGQSLPERDRALTLEGISWPEGIAVPRPYGMGRSPSWEGYRDLEIPVRDRIVFMDEIATLTERCPASVVVVLDSRGDQPRSWPDLFGDDRKRPTPGSGPAAPARIFCGIASESESANHSGALLTSLVAEGLAGAADREASLDFREASAMDAPPFGRPDGFVSLRELALMIRRRHLDRHRPGEPSILLRGTFGSSDAVLTYPGLPTE